MFWLESLVSYSPNTITWSVFLSGYTSYRQTFWELNKKASSTETGTILLPATFSTKMLER